MIVFDLKNYTKAINEFHPKCQGLTYNTYQYFLVTYYYHNIKI